jgi:hypothetical protein
VRGGGGVAGLGGGRGGQEQEEEGQAAQHAPPTCRLKAMVRPATSGEKIIFFLINQVPNLRNFDVIAKNTNNQE